AVRRELPGTRNDCRVRIDRRGHVYLSGNKSSMKSEHVDETLLVKYLLGDLSPEEEVRVEDRAFAEPDYLVVMEATEADLIDAYVRGDLSPAERRGFERRFLV